MITTQHQRWAHAIFRPYLRWLCRRRFQGIQILGKIPDIPEAMPILLLPNHSTWWDGFFPYLLNDAIFRRPYHVMMLEHRLREFWFFRFVGAFSINQSSPKGIVETLAYTASLLAPASKSGQTPLVVMFPQGELRPSGIRPLGYNRGVERVLSKATTTFAVIPLAMRCEFLAESKPNVFLECGTPRIISPHDSPQAPNNIPNKIPSAKQLETEMEHLLEQLAKRIIAGENGQRIL
jgi:1-acyl-sn-glycerol-3-phosphate acyltransferase